MRKVTYGAACSLDGLITGPDGAIDWLHFSRDVQDVMATYWATVDTVLMGRKTWEFAQSMQGGKDAPADGGADAVEAAGGERSVPSGHTTYVFSRTLERVKGRRTHLVRDDAATFVRDMKARPGGDICLMGGGELASSLLDAGVVDEVSLNIHPVLLGAGIPMFAPVARRVGLELAECRTLDGGCVLANYRVRA